MPRKQTILTAFVASPSDLQAEREELEGIVRELNTTWGQRLELRIELLKWETHTFPDIGEYQQAVINEQIGDAYDIFIGLLWKRFGTSTRNYNSGTEEEFHRALARHKRNPGSLNIMVYFKDAPVSPSELDPGQLRQIQQFKEELGPEGVYWWKFRGADDFSLYLRTHLSRIMQAWEAKAQHAASPAEKKVIERTEVDVAKEEGEPELGYLDLIETGTNELGNSTETLNRIAQATQWIGARMEESANAISALNVPGQPLDLNALKKLSNASASELHDYARRVTQESEHISIPFSKGIEAIVKVATKFNEFGQKADENVTNLLAALDGLEAAILTSRTSVVDFRETVSGLPRITTAFNRSKREVLTALDALLSEIDKSLALSTDAKKLLQAVK